MSAPSAETAAKPKKRVHPVDEVLPVPKLATYGFQHVVAFYAGAVLVPILIAGAIDLPSEELVKLITADLFTCGIASIIQAVGIWKIGVRLPLLQGVTFAGVSPIIAIGLAHGGGAASLLYVYGAVIVAGIFTFLIAPIFVKLLRFFPPVVTGTLITIIGLCLVPVGAHDAVTNPHTGEIDAVEPALAAVRGWAPSRSSSRSSACSAGSSPPSRSCWGWSIGCAVAFALGDMNFEKVGAASAIGFTQPFLFGMPKFDVVACLTMIIVLLITAVESTGSTMRHRRDRRQADQGLRHRQRAARRRPGHRDRRHLQLVPLHRVLGERRPGQAHRRQEPLGGGRRGRHHDPARLPAEGGSRRRRRFRNPCWAARR